MPKSLAFVFASTSLFSACEKKSYRAYDPNDQIQSDGLISEPEQTGKSSSEHKGDVYPSVPSSHSQNDSKAVETPPVESDHLAGTETPKAKQEPEVKSKPSSEKVEEPVQSKSSPSSEDATTKTKGTTKNSSDQNSPKDERTDASKSHAQETQASNTPAHKADKPTEIIPVSSDISANVVKSLDAGVRQGPECESKTQRQKVGSRACPNSSDSEALKEALWKLMIPIAYASINSAGPSIPDRTITQAQILKLAPKGSEFWKRYSKISNIHIFSNSDGPPLASFDFVITFADGNELWGRGSSDPKVSCLLIDKTFPRNGKAYFDAVEFYGDKKIKLQNPTRGKSCSVEAISRYRVLNLSIGSKTENPVPSFVVLLAKAAGEDQSYLLSKSFADERGFLNTFLARLNGEKSPQQKSKSLRGGRR